jgi:hypothetical protein
MGRGTKENKVEAEQKQRVWHEQKGACEGEETGRSERNSRRRDENEQVPKKRLGGRKEKEKRGGAGMGKEWQAREMRCRVGRWVWVVFASGLTQTVLSSIPSPAPMSSAARHAAGGWLSDRDS